LSIILLLSIGCCIVVGVLHSHLLFQCGFAEFIFMLLLEGATFFFCVYHLYNIYKFFKNRARHSGKKGIAAIVAALCSSELTQYNNYSEGRQGNLEDEEYEEEDADDDEEEEEEEEESKFSKVVVAILKVSANLIAVLCFIALILFTVVVVPLQQQTYPQVNGNIKLPSFSRKGASDPMIFREQNGMIHIKAEHDYDLYFAHGVAVAQDRLWQLEFNRRMVRGILSEVAGSDSLSVDKWFRTIGLFTNAQNVLKNIDAETLSFIQAYCDGINSYIDSNPPLQPEFYLLNTKPVHWEPVDSIAYIKFMSFNLAENMDFEVWRFKMMQRGITKDRINELVPYYPSDMPTILNLEEMNLQNLTPAERAQIEKDQQDDSAAFIPKKIHNFTMSAIEEMYQNIEKSGDWAKQAVGRSSLKSLISHDLMSTRASNNWAISGSKTSNKGALLANDPHLDFSAPGIWHLVHLEGPTHSVIGSALVGVPGVVIGKNAHISWGVSTALVDVQDLYVMNDANNGNSYVYNGVTKDYVIRNETIKVKGAEDAFVTIKESIYGPVVNQHYQIDGDNSLCLKSVLTNSNDTTVMAFLKLNRVANDWSSFTDALQYFSAPSQNFVYADENGNIGFYMTGLVPIRKKGHNGRYPVLGDGTYDYTGYIPFGELPHVYNPTKGYVSSANNRVTPAGYGYSLTQDWFAMYRSKRIVDLIENALNNQTSTVDFNLMKKMQLDVKSTLFDQFKFVFTEIANVKNLSTSHEKWRVLLTQWNGEEDLYSQQASIFEMWYKIMGNLTKVETVNRWTFGPYLLNALKSGDSACLTYHNVTCMEFAADSFEKAIESLEATYGSVPLWGSDIHEAEFPNPILDGSILKCLAGATHMVVGGTSTVNVGEAQYPALNTRFGVSYRQVVDWRGNQASFIIPLGQSGNFLSPFYSNFLELWSDPSGKYLDMTTTNYPVQYSLTVSAQ